MVILYSALVIVLIYARVIYSFWRIMVHDLALLGKYLSKKAFLLFYLGSQAQVRIISRRWCIIISILPIITTFIAEAMFIEQLNHGEFDFVVFIEKYKFNSAVQFELIALIVSWVARVVFCRWCFDKTAIYVRKIDPNFSLISKYRLLGYPVLDSILDLRQAFYWERRLFVERRAKGPSKKQVYWIYRVISCYVVALKLAKLKKRLFRSKKELLFNNRASTISFAEMLKLVSDCFDRSEFEVSVVRQARFGKTNQYLYQISKENEAKEKIVD